MQSIQSIAYLHMLFQVSKDSADWKCFNPKTGFLVITDYIWTDFFSLMFSDFIRKTLWYQPQFSRQARFTGLLENRNCSYEFVLVHRLPLWACQLYNRIAPQATFAANKTLNLPLYLSEKKNNNKKINSLNTWKTENNAFLLSSNY